MKNRLSYNQAQLAQATSWRGLLLAGIAGCILAYAPQALAGDDVPKIPPISPDELKMTAEAKAPGAPAICLYRQVDRDDGGGHREHDFLRIKILADEGRKYADVEIPFIKETAKVRDISARTTQPDGTAADFKGQIYEKTVVKAKGVKFLAKTFTLPDVRVGTIIEYSYTIDMNDAYVYDSKWILSEELFTKKARFSLKPSAHFALRWSWPIGLPEGTAPPAKEKNVIRLETQNVPAFQVEDYMPPANSLKYRVEFVYSFSDPETDQTKFWKQKGQAWDRWFEDYVNRRKAMEQAIAQIVSPSDTPETKLQKIYARVLQVHNTSFDREKTEKEEKREKRSEVGNVEDVWKRGFGDSRDVNWLFIALARAAGFEAYCVYVSERNSHIFDPKALNADQLDEDVILVKLQGKDLYLDPGSKYAPFGLLPWYETSVQGLLLDKDGGKWVRTPYPDSSMAKTERQADLALSDDGTLEGKLTVTYGGLEALELRTGERDDDDAARKIALEDLVKEAIPVGIEAELTNQPDWTTPSSTLVAEYHLKVPGWVAGAGRRSLLPVGLFSSTEKHAFEHANRVHAVYFHHPFLISDDVSITLPVGWKITSVPVPISQNTKAVAYVVKAEDNKGSVHINRIVRSDVVFVPKESYEVLRDFYRLVRTGDEQPVVLQPIS